MISTLLRALPEIHAHHARSNPVYQLMDRVAEHSIANSRLNLADGNIEMGDFGTIELPYHSMGAIDSLNLFGLDELIIFSFYWANRLRYRHAADIGANLGLHSLMMARCGWQVQAYEPDPVHMRLLQQNLLLNHITSVETMEEAVSDAVGMLEFVRVLGNTTGSHLAGAKPNPYGKLERFPVYVRAIADIMAEVDFIKLDAEGQEKTILLATNALQWASTDMMLEVGSSDNARAIFHHMTAIGIHVFSQKNGWQRVTHLDAMPESYKEGSVFISAKDAMPWNG